MMKKNIEALKVQQDTLRSELRAKARDLYKLEVELRDLGFVEDVDPDVVARRPLRCEECGAPLTVVDMLALGGGMLEYGCPVCSYAGEFELVRIPVKDEVSM